MFFLKSKYEVSNVQIHFIPMNASLSACSEEINCASWRHGLSAVSENARLLNVI